MGVPATIFDPTQLCRASGEPVLRAFRMTKRLLTMLQRTALMALLMAPAGACAKSTDDAAPSKQNSTATAKGASLSTFMSRHEKRLLAADTDGDGKVSRVEFLASAKTGKVDPAKRFAKLDTSGDAMLDQAEIDTMLSRRFKRLDTNGDGVLSPGERTAPHARTNNDPARGPES